MTDQLWRRRYFEHVNSARWRNMRKDIVRLRGNKCERCGTNSSSLQLHHKNYERLGKELTSDLELLCLPCHATADRERAERGRAKSASALYAAGLDTYASKKYGDDWAWCRDPDRVEEEYDD
jgi:hypothetical protein